MRVVLLSDFLSSIKLKNALREIVEMVNENNEPVHLIVDSHGGDIPAALTFVEKVNNLDCELNIKIYNALSAAAYIILALNARTKILSKDSGLSFHRGDLILSPDDVNQEGQIEPRLFNIFKRYSDALVSKLEERGVIGDPHSNAGFYASGWIKVDAERAKWLGVVDDIF